MFNIFALLPMAAYELGVWIKLLRGRLKRAMPRKEEAAQQELLEKHPEKTLDKRGSRRYNALHTGKGVRKQWLSCALVRFYFLNFLVGKEL